MFLGTVAGTASDDYEQDISSNVRRCDAFVAIADFPATGLGWELGVADERKIPTLIVSHREAKISRLLIGAASVRPHVLIEQYESMSEIPQIVNNTFSSMIK